MSFSSTNSSPQLNSVNKQFSLDQKNIKMKHPLITKNIGKNGHIMRYYYKTFDSSKNSIENFSYSYKIEFTLDQNELNLCKIESPTKESQL